MNTPIKRSAPQAEIAKSPACEAQKRLGYKSTLPDEFQQVNPKPVARLYLAGPVSKDGWRDSLFGYRSMSSLNTAVETHRGTLIYGGPVALGCDHGCYHRPGTHASLYLPAEIGCEPNTDDPTYEDGPDPRGAVVRRCFHQIRKADAVIVFIERPNCFGTWAELGAACVTGKPTIMLINPDLAPGPWIQQDSETNTHRWCPPVDEWWFVKRMAATCLYAKPTLPLVADLVFDLLEKRSVVRP